MNDFFYSKIKDDLINKIHIKKHKYEKLINISFLYIDINWFYLWASNNQ